MSASCDISSAVQVPPAADEVGMTVYQEPKSLEPGFAGWRYLVFEGGCIIHEYAFADGPYLTQASMNWYIAHYLSGGEGAADDPRVSPLLGDDAALAQSPPTHVVIVEMDVLRDEGEAYAARLESAGVPVTLRRYEGMFHGFFAFPEVIDVGRDAVAEAALAFRGAIA